MPSPTTHPLLDTWLINARIIAYVLDAVDAAWLSDVGATKGRSVGEMFAHIHNNRLLWLDAAAKDLREGVNKIEKDAAGDKALLRAAFDASAEAMAALVARGIETGRIKGFKPHPTAFVSYLVGHEFYHLGEIGVALQQSDHKLDQRTAYGMFEWGTR